MGDNQKSRPERMLDAGQTRTLSHELGADNIRVSCIMPEAILTERQQRLWLAEEYKTEILENQALKKMVLLPEEVARLVLFLASDDSSAITNQSYVIDARMDLVAPLWQ
jgi:NAD(P)-dependent dehydrogenase (short-subunit alcohol dehydrogenase family)